MKQPRERCLGDNLEQKRVEIKRWRVPLSETSVEIRVRARVRIGVRRRALKGKVGDRVTIST